jgi:hypothetical protein
MKKLIAAAFLLAAPMATLQVAQADDLDDLDSSDAKKKKAKKAKRDKREVSSDELVREVERGMYAKSSVGSATYLLNFANTLRSGTSLGLAFGHDFVDHEKKSMAWEISLQQAVHNGMHFEDQSYEQVPISAMVQGDTRTFTLLVAYEYSAYISRRVGIGLRVGGGLMLSPWLVHSGRKDEVLGTLGVASLGVHDTPHPLGFGGPTFEYYTKLSHFSVGVDGDVSYAVGFDLGVTATGYLKYTF